VRAKAQDDIDPEDLEMEYEDEGCGGQRPEKADDISGDEIIVKLKSGAPRRRSSNGRKKALTPKYVDSDVDMEPAESESGSNRDPDFVDDKGKCKARSVPPNTKDTGSPEPVDDGTVPDTAEDKVLEMPCSMCLVYGEDCTYSNRNLNNGKKVRSACDNCFGKKVKCSFACGTDHLPFFSNIDSKPAHIWRCVPVLKALFSADTISLQTLRKWLFLWAIYLNVFTYVYLSIQRTLRKTSKGLSHNCKR